MFPPSLVDCSSCPTRGGQGKSKVWCSCSRATLHGSCGNPPPPCCHTGSAALQNNRRRTGLDSSNYCRLTYVALVVPPTRVARTIFCPHGESAPGPQLLSCNFAVVFERHGRANLDYWRGRTTSQLLEGQPKTAVLSRPVFGARRRYVGGLTLELLGVVDATVSALESTM